MFKLFKLISEQFYCYKLRKLEKNQNLKIIAKILSKKIKKKSKKSEENSLNKPMMIEYNKKDIEIKKVVKKSEKIEVEKNKS